MMAAAAATMDELAATSAASAAPAVVMGALDRADAGYSDSVTFSGFALQRRWIAAPVSRVPGAVTLVVRVVVAAGSAADYEIATIAEARTP